MDSTHLSHLTTSLQSPTVVRRKYSVGGLQKKGESVNFFLFPFFAVYNFDLPAPAKILNIVLEGQLLSISESLGRSKGEGEKEKEHFGQILSSCLPDQFVS